MKQFNLTEWLQDKSRKVVTRDGRPVRIVCTDMKSVSPIIGVILHKLGGEFERNYALNGRYSPQNETEYDLFFADKEKTKKALMMNKEEALQQYEYEKQLFEQWGGTSIITFKEWLEIKSIVLSDEEEELTEFEKRFIELIKLWMSGNTNPDENLIQSRFDAKELFDLARKEIRKEEQEKLGTLEMPIDPLNTYYQKGREDALKDLPKWKKITDETNLILTISNGDYYLLLEDLEKLPKEE